VNGLGGLLSGDQFLRLGDDRTCYMDCVDAGNPCLTAFSNRKRQKSVAAGYVHRSGIEKCLLKLLLYLIVVVNALRQEFNLNVVAGYVLAKRIVQKSLRRRGNISVAAQGRNQYAGIDICPNRHTRKLAAACFVDQLLKFVRRQELLPFLNKALTQLH
jgi:hypothetical protein